MPPVRSRSSTIDLVILSVALTVWGCSQATYLGYIPVFPERQSAPAWSTQDKLAYVDLGVTCEESGGGYQRDQSKYGIWIYDLKTSSRSRLLPGGDTPAWDPTGTLLTVSTGRGLATFGIDGQFRWTLPTTGLAVGPSWSHDGQYLAWDQTLDDPGVWIAHRDTLVARKVISWPGYCSWHPLRSSILTVTGDGRGLHTTFHEFDVASGYSRTLFTLNLSATWPRYSPDGSVIVFSSRDPWTKKRQLYSIDFTGTRLRRLTIRGGDEPAWAPHGRSLAYISLDSYSSRPDLNALSIYSMETHEETQIVPAWPCVP
jgi:Tol biopolymer transport system component